MSLPIDDRIATNGLLIEREAAYARVSEIEGQINALFQGEFPFPAPNEIPISQQKRKPAKKKKAVKKTAKASVPKLRRLKAGEFAYRCRWLEEGKEQSSEAVESKPIEQFIKSPPSGVKIIAIETINLGGETQELIYSIS